MTKDIAWLTQKPIAHRGLHDGKSIPENSLAAFSLAIEKGYPIECDVRVLADGAIIVFHDAHTERLTGKDCFLKELTLQKSRKLSLCGTGEKVPTLDTVLALVAGRVPLLIEIKNNNQPGQLEHAVARLLEDYQGTVAVQSFNPLSVAWFQKNMPHIPVGQILQCSPSRRIRITIKRIFLRMKWFVTRHYPDFINYEYRCFPRNYCRALHKKKKIPILAWTIDSSEKLEKVQEMSDNIIFEHIDPSL